MDPQRTGDIEGREPFRTEAFFCVEEMGTYIEDRGPQSIYVVSPGDKALERIEIFDGEGSWRIAGTIAQRTSVSPRGKSCGFDAFNVNDSGLGAP